MSMGVDEKPVDEKIISLAACRLTWFHLLMHLVQTFLSLSQRRMRVIAGTLINWLLLLQFHRTQYYSAKLCVENAQSFLISVTWSLTVAMQCMSSFMQGFWVLQRFPYLLASLIIFYIQARIEKVLRPPMLISTSSYSNPKIMSKEG